MTNSPTQTDRAVPPATKQRRWVKPALLTVGAIVLLFIGVGIGAVGSGQSGLVSSQKAQIARLEHTLSTMRTQLTTAQTEAANAKTTAQNAVTVANQQAAAKYASREAAVQKMQRKLARELGIVAKSTISADGVYVVGRDIPSGTYHTSGGGECYYATLGSTDTSNILDNNNFNGPETVDVSGAAAFQISGGCTWHKIG